MNVGVVRPDAANLVLRAFGRVLHPDLLCHHRSARFEVPEMSLDVRLIAAGHAFVLQAGRQTVTEVISDRNEEYPVRGRLFEQRLKGGRTESVEFESGLKYDVSCTLERMPLSIFLRQHEELLADGPKASLFAEFPGANRFSPGPLSVVRTEFCRHSVVIHAYHTFPDQLSVVKTQSLVELS
ncbi:MAG: DUF2617 family protein [Planctomycetes bacterium]|nr:DUF2617 family protein [Planctomycetota bacterium]